jgi:predicted transcriptional regulator
MVTTIQISDELLQELKKRKLHVKESYEDVIWDLIEDQLELKEEVLKEIKEGLEDHQKGKFYTMDEVFSDKELKEK